METESKIQQSLLILRQVSPPVFGSLHHNRTPNLDQLDQLAQISVMRRKKSNDPHKTEPIYTDIRRKYNKIERRNQQNNQNQVTLIAILAQKIKRILQQMRYLQKPDVVEQQYQGIYVYLQLLDELHFYKNMHNMYVQYNPFDQKLPDDLIKKIGYKERTEALKEILKGQKQIIEFKRNLEKEKQRVPEFIKQLVDSDKKKQKKKSYS
ncbi:unnamed protein product (macronuclear) [Paramecium tetraurelia]|uniref:Uncharacterized protein n=1 Tax=Paramecium tetraurelia TaxID=5888 RepID=A0DAT2_PARTE|nr:uncharacterized protein GSPATT00015056001 [Paramecium tetraurelia]CAK80149.1 unnamed protein product [Paramecium tetraurelia]|eukprot:XP_001447546.1 hypothetical protein (macronuclear) [Paramecium tetraurelia strain d4-2]